MKLPSPAPSAPGEVHHSASSVPVDGVEAVFPALRQRADDAMVPASTMKLVTATVALANPAVSDSQKDKVSPRSVSSDTRRVAMVLMNYLAILLLAVNEVLDAGN